MTVQNNDGGLLPWQQADEEYDAFQTKFNEVIQETCVQLHGPSFSEIDVVEAANVSDSDQSDVDDSSGATALVQGSDLEQSEKGRKCSFGKTPSLDKLIRWSSTCRRCYCSDIDEGDSGVLCPWGKLKKGGKQKSGAVVKRKPYTSVFQRLCTDNKGKTFEFRHLHDVTNYMTQYRMYHTVADVGKEVRTTPKFGEDIPDPYAVKIKTICCADLNSVLSTNSVDSGREKDKADDKTTPSERSKRKRGDKPTVSNSRNVPSLVAVRPKKDSVKTELQENTECSKRIRDYVKEYEELKKTRELKKANSLPHIILKDDDASAQSKHQSRPSSDASSTTQRLIDEMESPLKRLFQYKNSKGGITDLLRESSKQRGSNVKLSELFSTGFLGDGFLRTSFRNTKVKKPHSKVKDDKEDNAKCNAHLPNLGTHKRRSDEGKPRLQRKVASVLSLSFDEMELRKSQRDCSSKSVKDDQFPLEYKLKKRQIQKTVDQMSLAK